MTLTLPWFPPAPAAGPASILSLPPDDWVMQSKIDGIRVIIHRGEPFNRLGEPLSVSKGAATLRAMFKGVDVTLDGEWVPGEGYHAFDLPDEPGDYDHRLKVMGTPKIPGVITLSYDAHFAQVYATLPRSITEGATRLGGNARLAQAAIRMGFAAVDMLKRKQLIRLVEWASPIRSKHRQHNTTDVAGKRPFRNIPSLIRKIPREKGHHQRQSDRLSVTFSDDEYQQPNLPSLSDQVTYTSDLTSSKRDSPADQEQAAEYQGTDDQEDDLCCGKPTSAGSFGLVLSPKLTPKFPKRRRPNCATASAFKDSSRGTFCHG